MTYSSHLAPADALLGADFSIVKMHQALVALKGNVYELVRLDKYWQDSIDICIDYYWQSEYFSRSIDAEMPIVLVRSVIELNILNSYCFGSKWCWWAMPTLRFKATVVAQ